MTIVCQQGSSRADMDFPETFGSCSTTITSGSRAGSADRGVGHFSHHKQYKPATVLPCHRNFWVHKSSQEDLVSSLTRERDAYWPHNYSLPGLTCGLRSADTEELQVPEYNDWL